MSKPAGVQFPSIITMRNCWERNPHGTGYAVADGNSVYIRKGFMTWDEFISDINFDALIDRACVFHFRYATHGSTSPGNCHPFPVVGNLKRRKVRTDVAVAHNGIVRGVQIVKKDYSDTMSYIERRIAPYWQKCREHGRYMYSVQKNQQVLLDETQSKWAFLYPNGKIFNIGAGIMQGGIWYSNVGFLGNGKIGHFGARATF
jgi:glutamine amidotransferase